MKSINDATINVFSLIQRCSHTLKKGHNITTTSRVDKKRKYLVSGGCVEEHALLRSEVRGQIGHEDWRPQEVHRTVSQLPTSYNRGLQKITNGIEQGVTLTR